MDMHALRFLATAKGLHNLSPDGPYCSQLCNLEEKVRSHRETEHDLPRRIVDTQAPFEHGPQIYDRGRDSIRSLLNIIRSAAAEHITAHHDRTQLWRIRSGPGRTISHLIIEQCQWLRQTALCGQFPDRVSPDDSMQLPDIPARSTQCRHGKRQQRQRRSACIHVQRRFIKLQLIEQDMHILQRHNAAALFTRTRRIAYIASSQRCPVKTDIIYRGAFVRFVTKQLIVVLGHRLVTGLRNPPRRLDVAIGPRSPQEIIHSGK